MYTPITFVIPPTRDFVQSAAVVNMVELGGIIYAQSAPPPPPPGTLRGSLAISVSRGLVIKL